MSDATQKNFQIVQDVMNSQARALRALQERVQILEGNVARLQAEITNTKQLAAHLHGRGMGSTVHE